MLKVFLAGPFFKPHQVRACEQVEAICAANLCLECVSPRLAMPLPSKPTAADKELVFLWDKQQLERSNVVLACIDDFDSGTMWEIGFCHAKGVCVVAYTVVPTRGLNVMLAESVQGFLQGLDAVRDFVGDKPDLNWEVCKQWQGLVQ